MQDFFGYLIHYKITKNIHYTSDMVSPVKPFATRIIYNYNSK